VAAEVLGPRWSAGAAAHGRIVVTVPPQEFRALARALRHRAANGISSNDSDTVRVVLRRSP